MHKVLITATSAVAVLSIAASSAHAQFANAIVDYDEGSNAGAFNDPTAALGEPTRTNADGAAITPFAPPSSPDEIVSIGEGGSLTVSFADPIVDNPSSVQFGIDFLIFGNAFFTAPFPFPADPVINGVFAEGGNVEVSADGLTFFSVTGEADGAFPTLGFSDVDPLYDIDFDGIDVPAGTVPTDFTRAVDPNLPTVGQNLSTIVDGYNGSGGGAGFDFSSTGLPFIQFVRVTNPVGSTGTPEIDGFADVIPEPSTLGLIGLAALLRRKR
ncbi:MAG: PEP-CTERM sorting domain-containing protein [Planctomycetota bacterium]